MTIKAEDLIIHYLKDKVGLREADRLVARLKGEVGTEIVTETRAFADQEDAHLATTSASVYVQGIRDTADRIAEKWVAQS